MTDDYAQRVLQDPQTGLFTYEYMSIAGSFHIEGITYLEGLKLADQLDAAEEWEPILARWANGYRGHEEEQR